RVRALATDLSGACSPGAISGPGRSWGAFSMDPLPQDGLGLSIPVQREVTHVDDRLTRREAEVLRLMAQGETNQRIANRLIISEGTVKSHVKHILRKLQAANRAEAVARWHGARPS